MKNGQEFRTYMKATNSGFGNDDRHLNETEMIAFCRGEMADAERGAARDHLAVCDYCIGLFRSARDFLDRADANDEEVTANQTSDAWQSLWQRVQTASPKTVEEASPIELQTEFQRRRDKKFFSDWRVTYAMAASLLISFGVLGLLGWRLGQERQSRQQSEQAARQLENKQRELNNVYRSSNKPAKRLIRSVNNDRPLKPNAINCNHYWRAYSRNALSFRFTRSRFQPNAESGEDLNLSFKKGVQTVRLKLFQSKPYGVCEIRR